MRRSFNLYGLALILILALGLLPVACNQTTSTPTSNGPATISQNPSTGGSCGVQFVTSVKGYAPSATTTHFTINASGTDTLLMLSVFTTENTANPAAVVNGNSMSETVSGSFACALTGWRSMYYYLNPPSGANAVTITTSAVGNLYYVAEIYSGVNQTTPIYGPLSGTGCNTSTGSPTWLSLTSSTDSLVDNCLVELGAPSIIPAAAQTQRALETDGAIYTLEMDDMINPSPGSVSPSYTVSPAEYYINSDIEILAQTACSTPTPTSTP